MIKCLAFLLGLASLAAAEPYKSSVDEFSVDFPHRPISVRAQHGSTIYSWDPPRSRRQGQAVVVLSSRVPHHRAALLSAIQRNLNLKPFGEQSHFSLGSYQGEEWSGVSSDGTPIVLRLLATPSRGYFWVATSLETSQNRAFVQSFRLVPGR